MTFFMQLYIYKYKTTKSELILQDFPQKHLRNYGKYNRESEQRI